MSRRGAAAGAAAPLHGMAAADAAEVLVVLARQAGFARSTLWLAQQRLRRREEGRA